MPMPSGRGKDKGTLAMRLRQLSVGRYNLNLKSGYIWPAVEESIPQNTTGNRVWGIDLSAVKCQRYLNVDQYKS